MVTVQLFVTVIVLTFFLTLTCFVTCFDLVSRIEIFLRGSLVELPEVAVGAHVDHQALVMDLDRADGVVHLAGLWTRHVVRLRRLDERR